MPERHTVLPTSLVEFKTGPNNSIDREEVFLLFSRGIEENMGRGLNRDGIGSPWMRDLNATRKVTDPDEQRRGSWLIDKGLALDIERKSLEAKRQNSDFRDRIYKELGLDPDQVIDEWLLELDRTPDHLSEFNTIYNSGYEVVGAQGNGNLTMNSWFMGFVNSEFTGLQPTFLLRRDEPFEDRVYSCLIKWVDKSYTIEPVRFNLYNRSVAVFRNTSTLDITGDIEFAVFGQQLVKNGQQEDFRRIVTQFEDIRHLFRLPNINPRSDLGSILQAKPPRILFGAPRDDDVWFGECELRNDEDLLRHALTEPILLNRMYQTMGADWGLIRKAFESPSGGYKELTGNQAQFPPTSRGEWRHHPTNDDVLEIYLMRNVYAYTMLGINDKGNIIASAAAGLAGRVGQTLEGMAQNMISFGARDVLLMDEGNDVFQFLTGEYAVQPLRGRLRSIFVFAKPRSDTSSLDI